MTAHTFTLSPGGPGISVTAPARLHLGFLDLHGGLGRRFASLGLALEYPQTHLQLCPAQQWSVVGDDAARAASYARALGEQWALPGAAAITIEQAIPPHSGLGSGTQLAIAVGVGLARLFKLRATAREAAECLGRGARSGIGIGAFEQGGFLVDGGRGSEERAPPLICRLPFPEDWRVLLIFDDQRRGVSGKAEKSAFAALEEFPAAQAERLCRLLLIQGLPALAEADYPSFGAAISDIQRTVGEHFAAVQGGCFASPGVAEVLHWLQYQGISGVGQSSWGPTGFALLPDAGTADSVLAELQQRCGDELRFVVGQVRNQPGRVDVLKTNRAS